MTASGTAPNTLATQPRIVGLVLAASCLVAAMAAAAPTGIGWWDAILRAGITAVVVLAASRAPLWAAIAAAAIAAAASFVTLWAIAAWIALVVGIGAAFTDRQGRVVGAVVAGLAMQSLLRMPAVGFFAMQSCIAAIAMLPVLVLGYRNANTRGRRLTRWSVGIGLVGVCLIGLIGGLGLLSARTSVAQGISAARNGLAAARVGNTELVADELEWAERSFADASDAVGGVGPRALRLLPVVAQHQRAVEEAVDQGRIVTVEAAQAVRVADIRTLRLEAGELDLAALSDMAPQLRSTATALDTAILEIQNADSPWLVSALRLRITELLTEIQELQPEIEVGAAAAEVLPAMLGVDAPQTYFVMFGTPAESRELGGFLGSWALLTFDDGQLRLGESGRIHELYDIAASNSVAPETVTRWYLDMARPTEFPQNLPSSPDMEQVAIAAQQVLAGTTDEPLAGFVYADGWALIELLKLSGPISIPLQEDPLTPENAFQFFFQEQYRLGEDLGRTELFDSLSQIASGVVARISTQTLPGPEELGRIMGPPARAGHLQVVTFDEDANNFLRSVKLLRDFERDETQDFVGLVQTNGLANKMDLYLERELNYEASIDDDGVLTATATASLRSTIPADAPTSTLGRGETVRMNKVLLSLYSPHGLVGATLDGEPVDVSTSVEFGLGRYLVVVFVPPNADARIVEFQLAGSVLPEFPYSLEVWSQPLVNTDQVAVTVNGPDTAVQWSGTLEENLVLEAISE